jgi:hypothetical protein
VIVGRERRIERLCRDKPQGTGGKLEGPVLARRIPKAAIKANPATYITAGAEPSNSTNRQPMVTISMFGVAAATRMCPNSCTGAQNGVHARAKPSIPAYRCLMRVMEPHSSERQT